jgi:hypothetical protein
MGIPGCIFLSYGSFMGMVISIGEKSYSYNTIASFFYIPVTLAAVTAGGVNSYSRKIQNRSDSLELLNRRLNKVNKDITDKMFHLKNDSTLEERRRISKEIHPKFFKKVALQTGDTKFPWLTSQTA